MRLLSELSLLARAVVILACAKEPRMTKLQTTMLAIDELGDYMKLSKSAMYHLFRRVTVPC